MVSAMRQIRALVLAGILPLLTAAAPVPPENGGLGTSTPPTAGQIPVGQSNGTYLPTSPLAAPGTLTAPVFLTASSGNYTVPAGVTLLRGTMQGGGGGGGGVSAAAATGASGLPGLMNDFVLVVTPGQIIAYTNGAGGARGANTGTQGGTGGDTTFGPFTAKGGLGGNGSTSGNAAAANPIGTGNFTTGIITGSVAVPSATAAITSQSAVALGGSAGASGTGGIARGIWGTSTPGTNGPATDCVGYGTGGSGAGSTSNTAGAGALGCPGAIVLW